MGVQAIAFSEGKAIEEFENSDDLFRFHRKHRGDNSIKIEYIPDSPMWDIDYKIFAERNIIPSIFDEDEVYERKLKSLFPYHGYKNSVRSMLHEYTNKIIVLLKEGAIDEDNVGDDRFVTMYIAHNMDWVSDFVRSFASRCCGEVAIYAVNHDEDVIRLFKSDTCNKKAFKVFNEKRYELFEGMWDAVGWHPVSVD